MDVLTNGALITIGNESYHTLDNWGLAVGNNNYIEDVVIETSYINIPGRMGNIDVSEALAGHPVYKKRKISIKLGGIRERIRWDSVISDFRNKIEGKVIKITFDNDKSYYWQGRCQIKGFDRVRELGTFMLEIPQADPYKYDIDDSTEPWKWDTFSFDTGIIKPTIKDVTVNESAEFTIPHGYMLTTPNIIAVLGVGQTMSVSDGKRSYDLVNGRNRFPSIKVNGDEDVTLTFTGNGRVTIQYRGGSL